MTNDKVLSSKTGCGGRKPVFGPRSPVSIGRRLFRDTSGQVLLFGAVLVLAILAFLLAMPNATRVTTQKVRAQTSADVGAFTGSVWLARALNLTSNMNIGIRSVYVSDLSHIPVFQCIDVRLLHNKPFFKPDRICNLHGNSGVNRNHFLKHLKVCLINILQCLFVKPQRMPHCIKCFSSGTIEHHRKSAGNAEW